MSSEKKRADTNTNCQMSLIFYSIQSRTLCSDCRQILILNNAGQIQTHHPTRIYLFRVIMKCRLLHSFMPAIGLKINLQEKRIWILSKMYSLIDMDGMSLIWYFNCHKWFSRNIIWLEFQFEDMFQAAFHPKKTYFNGSIFSLL